MSVIHDEIEIEDFTFDSEMEAFFYPCPCGDNFVFTIDDILNNEEYAICPSCSLIVKVIYDPTDALT
ncbi:hypothetical protein MXB_3668, partial [Myxobolus squamalis]